MFGKLILGFGFMIMGFLLFLNPYSVMHIADLNNYNYLIAEDTNESAINFTFDRKYISEYFDGVHNQVFINLYVDEFKNNETIENISSLELNDCYYSFDELAYQMSFVVAENCLNDGLNQTIAINKTSDLKINKIKLEYKGSNYETTTPIRFIQLFSLLIILLSIIVTMLTIEK